MNEIDETSVADYAIARGLMPSSTNLQAEFLAGGVSNVVLRVTDPQSGREIVAKQSREKLRVAADWRSRRERIWREVLALRVLDSILPPGSVPRVLDEDRENFAFTMTAAPRDHVVWKRELLDGRLRDGLLPQMGALLGTVHSRTWGGTGLSQELRDKEIFDELRLDPYYRWTAERCPESAEALTKLVNQTVHRDDCLTLADFSPKNILLGDDYVIVIDFETAHVGDPAFDLGFFLTHLVLKSLHVTPLREELWKGMNEFWIAYRDAFDDHSRVIEIEQRSGDHLAACLLARVDGKSPVDYLTPDEQGLVRMFATEMLNNPERTWARFAEKARSALR